MLADADVIFYIGANTDSVTTINWTLPAPASGKTIIQSDVDPVEIGNNYPLAAGLVSDAKLVLADLLDAIMRTSTPRALSARQKQMMDDGAASWWDEFRRQATEHVLPLKPQQIVAALEEVLPENSIVVADAGTPTPYIAAYFRSRAGRRVVIPRGYGGLGYALPAAIGAKLARPDAAVIALMGDGSFGMVATEFETLHRLGLPITVVQFNNAVFGWIKKLQQLHATPFYQSDFSSDTDHAAIARGFGVKGMKIDRPHDLAEVLHDAVRAPAPSFIDVPSADEVAAMPPVPQWQQL
jgi:acetolactate synthase-1/2/3 large subunit